MDVSPGSILERLTLAPLRLLFVLIALPFCRHCWADTGIMVQMTIKVPMS